MYTQPYYPPYQQPQFGKHQYMGPPPMGYAPMNEMNIPMSQINPIYSQQGMTGYQVPSYQFPNYHQGMYYPQMSPQQLQMSTMVTVP